MADSAPLLLCYDGSDDAAEAIVAARRLLASSRVIVLSVWLPASSVFPGDIAASGGMGDALVTLEQAATEQARELVATGADLAQQAGFEVIDTVVTRSGPPTWKTILEVAEARDVDAIVVGSRGRSGITLALLGSVSSGIVHHANRPVLVVAPTGKPAGPT